MKVSIYIEENIQQINLMPENKYEMNIIKSIKEKENKIEFQSGEFSTCLGGWVRFYDKVESRGEESLFLIIKQLKQKDK